MLSMVKLLRRDVKLAALWVRQSLVVNVTAAVPAKTLSGNLTRFMARNPWFWTRCRQTPIINPSLRRVNGHKRVGQCRQTRECLSTTTDRRDTGQKKAKDLPFLPVFELALALSFVSMPRPVILISLTGASAYSSAGLQPQLVFSRSWV